MEELMDMIRLGATSAGLAVLRTLKPEDFELQVKCGVFEMPVHEAAVMRTQLASIADSISNTSTDRTAKGDWQNVAWNLDPSKGNGGRKVSRSFAGY
ncbi:MAG: hypothetical protein QF535_23515 [Anaerolineales bacterium]|jgi:hypothetical protein|nr:hypothetical protein [Anaerolineales bacterium]|tara:strand:- start:256 stop:546 length:291 start_codon:yes stop_codon:yes gene_type:complete